MKGNWQKLIVAYGFIAPMPILTFMGLTWFSWATLLFGSAILLGVVRRGSFKRKRTFYGVIFATTVMSSLICLMSDMPEYWHTEQYKDIIWEILFYIIFMYFITSRTNQSAYFLKGIYYSSVFQMFWGFLQFVAFNVEKIKLNDLIFADLLRMQTRNLTQVKGDSIALSGMCWNAGNLVALMCFGYFFCKSFTLKLMFIVFSLLCGSRTLLLGMAICVIGDICLKVKKRRLIRFHTREFVIIVLLLIGCLTTILSNRTIQTLIFEKVGYLISAFSKERLQNQTSSIIHRRYWASIGEVSQWSGFIHCLFGWGNGCSGYPFSAMFGQFVGNQWVVECDYINRLWSFGYVGVTLWYGWFVKMMVKGSKIDKRYLILFLAILVEGITYNAILGWCYLTIPIVFSDIIKENNMFIMMNNE